MRRTKYMQYKFTYTEQDKAYERDGGRERERKSERKRERERKKNYL